MLKIPANLQAQTVFQAYETPSIGMDIEWPLTCISKLASPKTKTSAEPTVARTAIDLALQKAILWALPVEYKDAIHIEKSKNFQNKPVVLAIGDSISVQEELFHQSDCKVYSIPSSNLLTRTPMDLLSVCGKEKPSVIMLSHVLDDMSLDGTNKLLSCLAQIVEPGSNLALSYCEAKGGQGDQASWRKPRVIEALAKEAGFILDYEDSVCVGPYKGNQRRVVGQGFIKALTP